MGYRFTHALWSGMVEAASVVYLSIRDRAALLARLVTNRDPIDVQVDDRLAAYAEPASLPEPLLRSKVG
jgi:hypothetical protein